MNSFSADELYALAGKAFEAIGDATKRKVTHSLPDILKCGLAIFSQKCPSLFAFDRDFRADGALAKNYRALYGISSVASDTQIRERLDRIDPAELHDAFKVLHQRAKESGVYRDFLLDDDSLIIAIDGTGFFSSSKVNCRHCLEKKSRSGEITYSHQALCAVIVHPERSHVFPFPPEFICNDDGATKNDSERNAAKRLLARLKADYPNLKATIVEDALSSNAPHIQLLRELGWSFVIGAKPGDHAFLFRQVEAAREDGSLDCFRSQEDGVKYEIECINDVELNKSSGEKVNFLLVKVTSKKGKTTTFSWVTDIEVDRENWKRLMRIGRSRWKIENETFNTLKNQGYSFEHNFGHGYEHLCNMFGMLMFLQFFIDQLMSYGWAPFQEARQKRVTYYDLWNSLRVFFASLPLENWTQLFEVIAGKRQLQFAALTQSDTS